MIAIIFLFVAFSTNKTFSAVTITAPSLNITECSYPTSYNLLGDIVITEGAKANISGGGTLILTAPANFEFLPDPGSGVSVTTTNSDISGATVSVTSTTITLTFTLNGTANINRITISGVQIRALAASGSVTVTRTGGTSVISGDANGAVHASLSATTLVSAVTVTAAPNGSNLCVGAATAIGTIAISETICETDFGAGAGRTLILTAPTNFNFVAGVGSVSYTAGRDITNATIVVTTTTITVTIDVGSVTQLDFLSITGIQVTALVAGVTGNITRAAGAAGGTAVINGDAAGGGINHGTLTSIVSAATVNTATGGNCLTINGAYTTLGPVSITEQCPGDISAGSPVTFTINAPANYQFNTGALPTVSFTAGRNISAPVVTMTASVITITMNVVGTNLRDAFSVNGIQARATAAVPASNLTSGGTAVITGCPGGTLVGPVAGSAGAGTVTWVGTTTLWTTPGNWSGGVVPGVCSDVIIAVAAAYPTLTGATTVNSLTINSGASFTATAALTVNSSFTNNGTYNHNNATNASTTIFAGTESFSATSTIVLTNWYSAAVPLATYITGNLGNVTFNTTLTVWDQDGEFSNHLILGTLTVMKGQLNMDDGTGGSILLTLQDVITNGTGSIIFRQGAAPAGGTYTLRTKNFTHSGTAFTAIMLACPGNLDWQVTGNVSVSRDFSAAQGSAGQAINVNTAISGNLSITGGRFDMNETAYLASNTTVTVGGTTTFDLASGYTGYVTFLDGGTGNLSFTTANWSILHAQTSYYVSLMRNQAKGNPAPTGSVYVHVTNDMSMTGASVAVVYLIYNTANTSTCTLDIDHDLNYSNTGTGGMFGPVSNFFIANHNGALVVDIGHDLNLTNGTTGFYNIIGQSFANHTNATTATFTIGNDLLINQAAGNAAMIGTQGNEDLIITINGNFNLTNGTFYGINIGDGDFSLTTLGAFNMGAQGYFRGIYNASDYLAGSLIFNFNSVNYLGGGFVGMYGCNPTVGEKSIFNVTNNCSIFFDAAGLATQFWIVGLGTLGATNNQNGLTMTVGGNMLVSGDPSNTFASCNAAGSETVTITGNLAVSGGEVDFNVVQNSGLTTGHAVTMTIGGTLSIAANTGAGTYIGSQTFLSAETGALTATIGAISITANDATPFGILSIKGDDGVATVNVTGGYTQSGANSQFIIHDNTTDAGATTDIVTLTINSDDDASGDFSQTAGQINFDNNTTAGAMPIHVLNVKSPNYTVGGTGIINRATNPGTATASTGINFGELYFAHAAGIAYLNTAAPSTTHFIQNVKQFINNLTTVNATGATNNFMVASNSVQNNIAGTNTKWALNIDGTLNMGTRLITAQGPSATAYYSGLIVNATGILQTGNANGFYNGANASATIEPQVFSGNTSYRMDFSLNPTSIVEYNGAVNQVVTGKFPNAGALGDVVLATTAQYHYGILNINHQVALSATAFVYPVASNVFIRTRLDLTNGQFRLTDNAASPATGYTVTVENGATGAITSTATGYLRSELNLANNTAKLLWNNLSLANAGAHIYPFGEYNGGVVKLPVTFNNSGASGDVSVSTRKTATSTNAPFAAISNVAVVGNMNSVYAPCSGTDCADETVIDRWWDFTTSLNAGGATAIPAVAVTFTYQGAENTMTNAALRIGIIAAQHWDGTKWEAPVSTGVNGVTVGTSSVTAAGLTKFSPYILSSLAAPLPIELLSFNASLNGDKVDLKWVTATEINNDYFTVEKSRDGQNFVEVLNMDGAGNSTTKIEYVNYDLNPYNGISYYRLKQTDFNGQYSYSNIVSVKYNLEGNPTISIYPNPSDVGATTYLSLEDFKDQEVLVVLRDITGRELFKKMIMSNSKNELIAIDQDGTLAQGSYLITVIGSDQFFTKKLIVK